MSSASAADVCPISDGIIAYRSTHVNWENAPFSSDDGKPVLCALEVLLTRLRHKLTAADQDGHRPAST
jgi:hypothetical protein